MWAHLFDWSLNLVLKAHKQDLSLNKCICGMEVCKPELELQVLKLGMMYVIPRK